MLRGRVGRALALFWGATALVLGGLALTLQLLGPPRGGPAQPAGAHPPPADAHAAEAHGAETPVADAHAPPAPASPGHASAETAHPPPPARPATAPAGPGAPIAAADPALLEAAPSYEDALLPRIAADGRRPLRVYAAGLDAAASGPRIALLVSDFAMNAEDSDQAVRGLPAAVSFAVSPYAVRTERLLAAARARGHETLVSLPMEPQNFPLREAGGYALLTGAAPTVNAQRLEWALSRFTGYAGVTGALGALHGERFAAASELFAGVLQEVGRRGLLYVDPRPGATPPRPAGMPPFRAVDVVVDAPPLRGEVDDKLARLEQLARERGSALGLANDPLPMVVERIGVWATALPARGFVLVPVSALVAPADKPQ